MCATFLTNDVSLCARSWGLMSGRYSFEILYLDAMYKVYTGANLNWTAAPFTSLIIEARKASSPKYTKNKNK